MLYSEGLAFYAAVQIEDGRNALIIESPSLISSCIELTHSVKEMQVNYPFVLISDESNTYLYELTNYEKITLRNKVHNDCGRTEYISDGQLEEAKLNCKQISYFGEHEVSFLFSDRAVIGEAEIEGEFAYVVGDCLVKRLTNEVEIWRNGEAIERYRFESEFAIYACGNGIAIVCPTFVQICSLPDLCVAKYEGITEKVRNICFTDYKIVCELENGFGELICIEDKIEKVDAARSTRQKKEALKIHEAVEGNDFDEQRRREIIRKLEK